MEKKNILNRKYESSKDTLRRRRDEFEFIPRIDGSRYRHRFSSLFRVKRFGQRNRLRWESDRFVDRT